MLGSTGRQQHRTGELHDGRRFPEEKPVEGTDAAQGEARTE